MDSLINQKVEELRQLCKMSSANMLLILEENTEERGNHFVAYGSGEKISELIIKHAFLNNDFMKVLKIARDTAFPSPLPVQDQNAAMLLASDKRISI